MRIATQSMDALKRITFARSADSSKPALSRMVLESAGPGKVYAAATNGFILAWGVLDLVEKDEDLGDRRLIIPGKLADKIGMIRVKKNTIADLEITDTEALLHLAGFPTQSMRWVGADSVYPRWMKIIPSATPQSESQFGPLAGVRFQSGMLTMANKALGHPEGFLHIAVSTKSMAIAAYKGVFVQICPINAYGDYENEMIAHLRDSLSAVPLFQNAA